MRRIITTFALSLSLALGLVACSPAASGIDMSADAVLIDVRTPSEFASGHLEGAINIDVQSADFETLVSELDPNGEYIVYCRSGNRSGQAIDRMETLGFTNLVNAGSVDGASNATGVAVVTGP